MKAKITPADYPDLLAARKAGVSQRELAKRYNCAPSLIARHEAKAERARELSERKTQAKGAATSVAHRSAREILEERLHDPMTSARDLAALVNALARLEEENKQKDVLDFHRVGSLLIEPEQRGGKTWRMLLRVRGGIERFAEGLAPEVVWALVGCYLLPEVGREALGIEAADDVDSAGTSGDRP